LINSLSGKHAALFQKRIGDLFYTLVIPSYEPSVARPPEKLPHFLRGNPMFKQAWEQEG
jgi:hypothetical protein